MTAGRPRKPLPADGNPTIVRFAEAIRELSDRYGLGVRHLGELSKSNPTLWSNASNARVVPAWTYFETLFLNLRELHPNHAESLATWKKNWQAAQAEADRIKKAAQVVNKSLEEIDLGKPFVPDIIIKGENVIVRYPHVAQDGQHHPWKEQVVSSATNLAAFAKQSGGSLRDWLRKVENAPTKGAVEESAISAIQELEEMANQNTAGKIRRRVARFRERRVDDLARRIVLGEEISLAGVKTDVRRDVASLRRTNALQIGFEAFIGIAGACCALAILAASIFFVAGKVLAPTIASNQEATNAYLALMRSRGVRPRILIFPGPPLRTDMAYSLNSDTTLTSTFELSNVEHAGSMSANLWVSGGKVCSNVVIPFSIGQKNTVLKNGSIPVVRDSKDTKTLSLVLLPSATEITFTIKVPPVSCNLELHLADAVVGP